MPPPAPSGSSLHKLILSFIWSDLMAKPPQLYSTPADSSFHKTGMDRSGAPTVALSMVWKLAVSLVHDVVSERDSVVLTARESFPLATWET